MARCSGRSVRGGLGRLAGALQNRALQRSDLARRIDAGAACCRRGCGLDPLARRGCVTFFVRRTLGIPPRGTVRCRATRCGSPEQRSGSPASRRRCLARPACQPAHAAGAAIAPRGPHSRACGERRRRASSRAARRPAQRHCRIAENDIAADLVRNGHVFALSGYFSSYGGIEDEAREAKRGVWAGTPSVLRITARRNGATPSAQRPTAVRSKATSRTAGVFTCCRGRRTTRAYG